MPVNLVGKYVLVFSHITNIIPNSSEERQSFDSPFYLIEKAAELSGAWSYVPCARNDLSSPWAMLVPNSTTDTFLSMPVIEWYYRNESGTIFLDCSHFYNGPSFSQKSDVLNATDRTSLQNDFNLVRKNGSYDFCTVSGTTDDCTRIGFRFYSGLYFAYVGPDVVMFGNLGLIQGQSHPYYNVHIINFYRDAYGGFASRSFLVTGTIGTYTGRYSYWRDRLSNSTRITSSFIYVPQALNTFNIYSGKVPLEQLVAAKTPYLALLNNSGSIYQYDLYKLDWLMIGSASSPFSLIKYENNCFYKVFLDKMLGCYLTEFEGPNSVYIKVDEVYSRNNKTFPSQ